MSERPTSTRVLSHLGVMVVVSAVLGVLVAGLAIPFAGVVGVSARNVADTMDNLPEELETEQLSQRSTILDVDGNVLATLYDQNRVEVPLSQVSRKMVKAIVAVEDARFYQHGALDLQGTLRAFITNAAQDGTVQGGSSITQQLVKQTLVNQATTDEERAAAVDDTYARKLKELRYAVALEQNHTKDWILERYLNIAYFGDGAYGIQSAAKHFFNTNASKLNVLQSATLAGLVRNPEGYDPTDNPERALQRRNVVLQRMNDVGILNSKRVERLQSKPLKLDVQKFSNGCVFSAAPFFCDYVIQWLLKDDALGKNKKERRSLLNTGGLTIRTTLDLDYQRGADAAVRDRVYPRDNAIGALAMVEPGTGDVHALAQSRPMGADKAAGQTYLNYTVPKKYGDSGGFQPGSTFKAFVLAAAVEQGIPLNTQIAAPQTRTFQQNEFKVCNGQNFSNPADYPVSNSTGEGTFNLYTGTQKSVNTFYIELSQRVGLCKPFTLAKQMGIVGLKGKEGADRWMVPSFALGVASVSPLEMAEAYATFAERGLHCSSRPVTSIEDMAGNTLKEYPSKCRQVMENSTADAVNDVLRGVIEPGGFASSWQLDSPAAGKTGTTQDGKSVWFVGYTPTMAAAAMIAGANQSGTPISLTGQTVGPTTIYSASGSGFAAPIWGTAMRNVMGELPNEDFVAPSASDVAGVPTTVPSVSGRSVQDATRQLEDAGFVVSYGGYVNSGYAEGLVAYSSPGGGAVAPSSSSITLYQSNGRPPKPPKTNNNNGGNNNGNGNGRGNGRGNGNNRNDD